MQTEIDFRPPSIARVVDLETTGTQENEDARICELGFVDLDLLEEGAPERRAFTAIVNPDQKMSAEVMAVHHLTDEDVANGMHVLEAWDHLHDGISPDDVFVAHNAKFERHFLPTHQRWVCTYRCAVRAWPDAPGHSNQVLRYHLGVDLDRQRADPPHRALPDAYVTSFILRRLLQMRPIQRLIEVTNEPVIFKRMSFGKHKGMLCSEVPADYWDWYLNKATETNPDQLDNARFWFNRKTERA